MTEKETMAQETAADTYGIYLGRDINVGPRLDDDETQAFRAGWEAAKDYLKKQEAK